MNKILIWNTQKSTRRTDLHQHMLGKNQHVIPSLTLNLAVQSRTRNQARFGAQHLHLFPSATTNQAFQSRNQVRIGDLEFEVGRRSKERT